MIKRLADVEKRGEAVYIRTLQTKHMLNVYSVNGCLAYDTDEFETYREINHSGRPSKDIGYEKMTMEQFVEKAHKVSATQENLEFLKEVRAVINSVLRSNKEKRR